MLQDGGLDDVVPDHAGTQPQRLARAAHDRTAAGGAATHEQRDAHLTLLRFPGAGADFHTATDLATPDHDASTLAFEVRTVCLMKSTLHPLGVRHELLREFALG